LLEAARDNRFFCTILRPSNVYGIDSSRINQLGFIHTLIDNHIKNRPTRLYGDGEIVRDYLYISDAVELIYSAIFRTRPGIYNVSSDDNYSLNQIIALVAEITGEPPLINQQETRNCDVKKVVLNSKQARKTFEWSPKVSIKHGIQTIINDKTDSFSI